MEPVILTWRPVNFLTVALMIVVIGLVTALVAQGIVYASKSMPSKASS
jgi:hypothetical protein